MNFNMNDKHILSQWRRGIRLHLIVAVSTMTMLLVWWNQFDFYPYMQNKKHVLIQSHPSTRFSLVTFLSNASHIISPSLPTRTSALSPNNKNDATPLRIPPALDQLCHTYNGLTPINNCCQFFNFKANYSSLILRCFVELSSAHKHRYYRCMGGCVCRCVMPV